MKAEEITAFEALIHKPVKPGEFSWDEYISTCAQSCGLCFVAGPLPESFLPPLGQRKEESILEVKLNLSKWSISPEPAPPWWNGCCVFEHKFMEFRKFQKKSFSLGKAAFQTHLALGILLQFPWESKGCSTASPGKSSPHCWDLASLATNWLSSWRGYCR